MGQAKQRGTFEERRSKAVESEGESYQRLLHRKRGLPKGSPSLEQIGQSLVTITAVREGTTPTESAIAEAVRRVTSG